MDPDMLSVPPATTTEPEPVMPRVGLREKLAVVVSVEALPFKVIALGVEVAGTAPRAVSEATLRLLELTMIGPEKPVLAAPNASVPPPLTFSAPVPVMAEDNVRVVPLAKLNVPPPL